VLLVVSHLQITASPVIATANCAA